MTRKPLMHTSAEIIVRHADPIMAATGRMLDVARSSGTMTGQEAARQLGYAHSGLTRALLNMIEDARALKRARRRRGAR